jgi:hypothetical protein
MATQEELRGCLSIVLIALVIFIVAISFIVQGQLFTAPVGQKKIIKKIRGLSESRLLSIEGAFVEDNAESVKVHYRLASSGQRNLLKTIIYP